MYIYVCIYITYIYLTLHQYIYSRVALLSFLDNRLLLYIYIYIYIYRKASSLFKMSSKAIKLPLNFEVKFKEYQEKYNKLLSNKNDSF